MKDVAARAGVGLTTVSRVVSGEGVVSFEKVEAVRRAIDELGFSRNDFARTLRTGRSGAIGMVVTEIADPFYATLVGAVEQRAEMRGLLVLVASATDDPEQAERVIRRLLQRRLDGLIVVAPDEVDVGFLRNERSSGTPVVFIDRPPIGRDVGGDVIMIDNEGGAEEAVAHLIGAGHRRIACFAHVSGRYTSEHRQAGYFAALTAAGLRRDPALVVVAHDVEACVDALREMLAQPDPPTAIFSTNSWTTRALLQAFRLLDFHPALVGFDDFELAGLMVPPTTTMAQDPRALGGAAADLLFERMSGLVGPPQHLLLQARLIERGSGEMPPAPI